MQRYFSNKKENNSLFLNNDDIYHITKVMRMKDKSKIEVVYNHELYICEFNNGKADIISHIDEKISSNDITLIIPLLVESKMDFILQKSTELGVSKIIPVIMERSKIKFDFNKETKKVERWRLICKEASEQSKRLDIPIVTNVKSIDEIINIDGLKLICSTQKNIQTIKKFLTKTKNYDKLVLVIGPEGGFSNKEEEILIKGCFEPISLGKLIMRVETVPIYLLSVINYENME